MTISIGKTYISHYKNNKHSYTEHIQYQLSLTNKIQFHNLKDIKICQVKCTLRGTQSKLVC